MKKIYLIGLMGCFTFANAQAPKTLNAPNNVLPMQRNLNDYVPASPVIAPNHTQSTTYYGKSSAPPVKVGETNNDRQANASIYRRILTYPGNKISVAWMTSSDGPDKGYLARGTGYNTFDGTSWGAVSTNRIEQNRAGYPNLDYSAAMGQEIIFSHRIDTNSTSGGLIFSNNLSIGSGTWTGQIVLDSPSVSTHPSVLWPRTVVSGNYIHVIATYSVPIALQPDTVIISGVRNPTVYSRYNVSSKTWEVKNITLPGYDGTRWRNGVGDGYSIDAKGNNVAILMGGLTNDISLWKSADNGNTWTNTIIDSFPVPSFNFDVVLDTAYAADGSLNVILDGAGMAHCFWAQSEVWDLDNATDKTITLSLAQNSINYWYEGRPDSIHNQIGYSPDMDGDGAYSPGTVDASSRYDNSSASTMPYATMDNTGRIFVVYSGITETDVDGGGHGFRDIYCVYSADNGVSWSTPRNLTAYLGFNTEQMFASLPPSITNTLQMTYMPSSSVGFWDATNNSSKLGPFDIMYLAHPVADIIANNVGISEVKNDVFSMDQNFPNPFKNETAIPVELKMNTDVNISVINIVGQTVYAHTFEKAHPGLNNFQLDLNNLNSGVYFYTVEAEGYKITKRMMVE